MTVRFQDKLVHLKSADRRPHYYSEIRKNNITKWDAIYFRYL